jgi:ribosome-binding protein aMBF1 (putative translation factor)
MPPHRILKTIDFFQRKQNDDAQYIDGLWKDFGASVRETRRDQCIGLRAFAKQMKVSSAMIGYLESGKRQWNFEMARKAVKILSK